MIRQEGIPLEPGSFFAKGEAVATEVAVKAGVYPEAGGFNKSYPRGFLPESMSPEKNLKLKGVREACNSKPLRWMSKKRITSFSLDAQ